MLRAIEDLDRMKLSATDGEIGRVEDVYFDDQDWTVRYLVVDTGGWLSGAASADRTAIHYWTALG